MSASERGGAERDAHLWAGSPATDFRLAWIFLGTLLVYSSAPMPVRRSAVVASIDRRRFLKVAGAAGAGAAAPAVAAPAIAQSSPELQWRMPVSWPKTLDTLYGGA